jgi:competence protein ComEC
MHLNICAFFAGVLALQWLPALWLGLAAIPLFIIALWLRRAPLIWLTAGILWAGAWAAYVQSSALLPDLEGETLIVTGRLTDFPARTATGWRFDLSAQSLRSAGRAWPAPHRIRLSWYEPDAGDEPPQLGERWQLAVRLRRPWGMRNPGTFDYERWLFGHRIGATGYVVPSRHNRRLAAASCGSIPYWRARLFARLEQQLGDAAHPGILTALLLGKQDAISEEEWRLLRDTGTAHLISVSGLHISLSAAIGFLFARGLCSLFPPLLLRLPAQSAGWLGAAATASLYSALAGFSLPTVRAFIMLLVALVQRARGQYIVGADTLCAALFIVLLLDPLCVLDASFWLSFAAVAFIFWMLGGRAGPVSLPARLCRIHLALALGLAPLAAQFFQQNPLLGPLANLFAVPWVSFLILPCEVAGVLLGLCGFELGAWFIGVADAATSYMMSYLMRIAALDFATIETAPAGLSGVICAAVGVLLLLLPRGLPGRWLGCVWLAPLVIGSPQRPVFGEAHLHVLDVGQGLAAVVETERHVLVFDTGPHVGTFDAGAEVLVPFLKQRRIARVARLILSHSDNDHAGGAEALMAALSVESVLHGGEGGKGNPCRAGMHWRWDGVEFEILHPGATRFERDNDGSCVLRITAGGARALLPGDVEAAGEATLLAHAERLDADVLVAPHHGSRTSSSQALVNAVAPRYVVFASGYRNRFGFPAPEVVARYEAAGAETFTTFEAGALTFVLNEDLSPPRRYRANHRKYWHSR